MTPPANPYEVPILVGPVSWMRPGLNAPKEASCRAGRGRIWARAIGENRA